MPTTHAYKMQSYDYYHWSSVCAVSLDTELVNESKDKP